MKLGGLFSGVGGFELAWTQLGHEVAWMCEVDKKAQAVLRERFPGITIYDDVRKIDPAKVEAVDVLTGGSPCQGFSVAGRRTGLDHEQSTLFHDYVRILDGLAERGLKWALWENVPGVLSIKNSDGGRTFPHVISGLLGAAEPVHLDPKRKWNTGVAAYGGREVAWRVLDSQHFGVAQRRRRVFACVAVGHSDAGAAGRALLAVSEGVRGDTAPGGAAGQEAAGAAAEGAGGTLEAERGLTISLQASTGGADVRHAQGGQLVPAVLMTMREGKPGGGKGPLMSEEQSLTLATGNGQTLFQPQAFDEMNFATSDQHHVLRAGTKQPTGVIEPTAFRKSRRAQTSVDDKTWVSDGKANTVNTFDVGETRTTHAVVEPPTYGVRRLTPVECERLQSFPDGWTDVPGASDSSRYKAMGNAVTVNTVRWILSRIAEA